MYTLRMSSFSRKSIACAALDDPMGLPYISGLEFLIVHGFATLPIQEVPSVKLKDESKLELKRSTNFL